MTVYLPRVQSQLNPKDPNGRFNCAAYAAAMAFDRATLGGWRGTGIDVRAATNEPIPDPGSEGLGIGQLVGAAQKLRIRFVDRSGAGWAGVVEALHAGCGVVLIVVRAEIPPAYRCGQPFAKVHALYLHAIGPLGQAVRGYDPLCTKFLLYPVDVLRAAGAAWRSDLSFGRTRAVPPLA